MDDELLEVGPGEVGEGREEEEEGEGDNWEEGGTLESGDKTAQSSFEDSASEDVGETIDFDDEAME